MAQPIVGAHPLHAHQKARSRSTSPPSSRCAPCHPRCLPPAGSCVMNVNFGVDTTARLLFGQPTRCPGPEIATT